MSETTNGASAPEDFTTLDHLTRDQKAVEDGHWVKPDGNKTLEFLARGHTPKYLKRRSNAMKRLTEKWKDEDIPSDLLNKELAKVLFEECILDVRGIRHRDGRPASLAEVRDLCMQPKGEPMLAMAFAAVERVAARRMTDVADAEGNSSPSSSGTTPT